MHSGVESEAVLVALGEGLPALARQAFGDGAQCVFPLDADEFLKVPSCAGLEAMLRRSIEKNEIFLNYQPQVEIDTGRLIGVEALVRWDSPELGMVPPVRFIPIAETNGLINLLGAWALKAACAQIVPP